MFNVIVVALLLSFIPGITAAPFEVQRSTKAQLITQCTVPNAVALTFDDGPYDFLKDVVNAISNVGGKATFFFNGNNWRCIYDELMVEQAKYAYDHGFQVASHTWHHWNLSSLAREQVDSEMAMTEDAIHKILGVIPAYTRPPYGAYNDLTLEVAGARGQTLVNWSFDSKDSLGATVEHQKELYDELIKNHPTNIISLQHEVYNTSVYQVLPYAIKLLHGAGYKLVTLSECLGTNPYLTIGSPSTRDDTWHC